MPTPPASSDFTRAAWWPWPLTLELVRNVSRGTDNLPANCGVSANLQCWALDWQRNLITLTFCVTVHVNDLDHCAQYLCQVWSSSVSPFRIYGAFCVLALIGIVTLTFDLSVSKWGHWSPMSWASSWQFSASYAVPLLTWGQARDRQTDRLRPSMLNASALWGRGIIHMYNCLYNIHINVFKVDCNLIHSINVEFIFWTVWMDSPNAWFQWRSYWLQLLIKLMLINVVVVPVVCSDLCTNFIQKLLLVVPEETKVD